MELGTLRQGCTTGRMATSASGAAVAATLGDSSNMTTDAWKRFFWEAEPSPLVDGEWLIRSEGGERCVFNGLTEMAATTIAMTHNWEIQRIDQSSERCKKCGVPDGMTQLGLQDGICEGCARAALSESRDASGQDEMEVGPGS